MTEPAHHHDVLTGEPDDRCQLAHSIVYGARIAHRGRAEEVVVYCGDGIGHVFLRVVVQSTTMVAVATYTMSTTSNQTFASFVPQRLRGFHHADGRSAMLT